jgi:FixJ family two-component response regulator
MTPCPPDASLIAIVDDHEAVRKSAGAMLGSLGYSVIGFASGEAFLDPESPAAFGCVLLDMQMPGCMSGLSVLRTLR